MELRQLRHFVAVAEELHFTRAAARVHVVQSTLSASISALEQELGTPLLVRNSRRVDLTTAGRALFPDARRALAAADDGRAAVEEVRGVLRGILAIGAVQGIPTVDLPRLLARYHENHPGIGITVRRDTIEALVQATADGDLDLAFVSRPYDASRISELPLGTEPLVLAVPCGDRLVQRQVVPLIDLKEREFVERQADCATRMHIDAVCAELGFERTVCAEANTLGDLVELVEAGAGVALLPPTLVENAAGVAGVTTDPVIVRQLAIVTPVDRPSSPAAIAFLDDLHSVGDRRRAASSPPEPART